MKHAKTFIIIVALTLLIWVFVALNSTPKDWSTALFSIPGFIIMGVVYFKVLK